MSLITPAATDIWTAVSRSSAGEQPYSKPFLPVFKQKNFCESREAAQHANILLNLHPISIYQKISFPPHFFFAA